MCTRLAAVYHCMSQFVDRVRCFLFQIAHGIGAVLLLCLSLPDVSHAGSFHVTPVKVVLSLETTTYVLRVENSGAATVTLQLKALAWSQQGGRDQLQPTREVLVTPPLFNLKPGAMQIVRVGLMRKPDPVRELSYRLLLEEIPPPPAAEFKGVQVALRIGIPIFVAPISAARQDLSFTATHTPDGQLRINVANRGLAHAQITGMTLHSPKPEDSLLASYRSPAYVLPGQERELILKPEMAAPVTDARLAVRAQTPSGLVESYADLIRP